MAECMAGWQKAAVGWSKSGAEDAEQADGASMGLMDRECRTAGSTSRPFGADSAADAAVYSGESDIKME